MKVLLISDLPPCTNHTGGLYITRQCECLLRSGCEIYAYMVKNKDVDVEIPDYMNNQIKFIFDDKPKEYIGKTKGPLSSFAYDNYCNFAPLRKIKKRIVKYAKEIKPDIIWGIAQGQTMTKIIRPVAQRCNIKYVVQLFDPICWWLTSNKVDKVTVKRVMREYGKMINNAYCLIGPSEEMERDYAIRYGCERSVGIMMPFSKGVKYRRQEKNGDNLVIAISGQLYARSTILKFINALTNMGWKYGNKKIIFRIYGPEIVFNGLHDVEIEYKGWIDQDRLLQELNTADLLYCPYRFDEGFREVATYSFPGKLSTYMKTGVPILVHSPDYSSISKFVRKYECGYVIDSVETSEIESLLVQVLDDANKETIVNKANEVADDLFSEDVTQKKMEYAFGISNSV